MPTAFIIKDTQFLKTLIIICRRAKYRNDLWRYSSVVNYIIHHTATPWTQTPSQWPGAVVISPTQHTFHLCTQYVSGIAA